MSLAVTDPIVWSLFALKTAAGACGLIGTEALIARSLRPTRRLVLCLGLFLGIGLYASLFSLATPVLVIAGTGWLRTVFVVSGLTAGTASLIVGNHRRDPRGTFEKLDRLELILDWFIVVELAALTGFSLSMRGTAGIAFQRWPGMLIPLFVVPVGLVLPLVQQNADGRRGRLDAALFVLFGEFVLCVALVGMPLSLGLR